MIKLKRKFDGKIYGYLGVHSTKKLAEDHKESLKRRNYLVRIVKLKKGYCIYVKERR